MHYFYRCFSRYGQYFTVEIMTLETTKIFRFKFLVKSVTDPIYDLEGPRRDKIKLRNGGNSVICFFFV